MTQNPFQPWKQTLNLNTNFFRKNEEEFGQKVKNSDFNINQNNPESLGSQSSSNNLTAHSHSFELSNESQHNYPPAVSSTEEQLQQQQQKSSSNPKFSIFNQLNNLHKVNAFDNLLNATTNPDDEELSDDKKQGMRLLMEQAISDEAKQQIAFIMEKISMLRPAEKMLLYLKMPGVQSDSDPLKQSQNPLGSRSEISHTINWVRSHLEHDSNVSIPKQEVYEDYVTYCGKISIKPLSTADFGKVMKQVFPDIRPRRLGTRGHSRYCYAAMRKATKLKPPQLADISSKNAASCDGDKEEVAWNIVKSWSESLLNSQFQSVDELANHISTNHLNSPSNTTSKQLLQKKLLQREMKEKKRLSNQSKKKRKKRRKSLSTSSDAQQIQEMYDNHHREIKQEKETDGSAVENNDAQSENSSDVPMNLTNTEMSMNRVNVITDASSTCHSTNESVATTFNDQLLMNGTTIPINSFDMPSQSSLDSISKHTTVRNKLKHKINSSIIEAESQQQPLPPPSPLGEDNQYILCKKVRQAHQAKNLMMSAMAASQFIEPPKTGPITNDPEIATQMLMPSKIPAKRKFRKEHGTSNGKKSKTDGTEISSSPLNHVEPSDLVVKNGDLKEDFILPRERFISICNMDKNALDTYLNLNEDSSQDPELLQYFGEDKSKKPETIDEGEDLGAPSTSIPLLENYQLFSDSNKSEREQRHSDKLSQLRSMLEEKYQQGGLGNDSVIKNLLLRNTQHTGNVNSSNDQLNMYHGSASNSLALMSQRHNNNLASVQAVNSNHLQGPRPFPIDCVPDTDTNVPQSPNSRRRTLGFLPITHTAKGVKNINNNPLFKTDSTNASPFVSPRATPIPKRNTNKCLNLNQHLLNVQEPKMMIGTNNTAFSRPQQFKMEPVSAPPSPSMVQHFHFGNQSGNCFQFQNVNQQNSMYPVESRSQSVPPHCTNTNLYNNNTNYNTNYSSACSSVAPTPVPSEYADFSDNVILDIFNNGPQVKLEATEDSVISELLENEILNQNSDTNEADLMVMNDVAMRQNFASISRSVPNTPLPYHLGYNHNNNNNNNNNCNNGNSNNNNNNMYSMGKSVPNTPIANNNCNPFRYSPELTRTRDFLINGFNNNVNNNNNNNDNVINKMIKSHEVGTGSGVQLIEDLDSSILSGL